MLPVLPSFSCLFPVPGSDRAPAWPHWIAVVVAEGRGRKALGELLPPPSPAGGIWRDGWRGRFQVPLHHLLQGPNPGLHHIYTATPPHSFSTVCLRCFKLFVFTCGFGKPQFQGSASGPAPTLVSTEARLPAGVGYGGFCLHSSFPVEACLDVLWEGMQ